MRIRAVAFTQRGCELAVRVASQLVVAGEEVHVSAPSRLANDPSIDRIATLAAWTEEAFAEADALLFVSACGIAVRAIAPYVKDKMCDPAVVCIDEAGRFAISLLSGHVGGANDLARRVAAACGGLPVITTATDVRGIFAVDEWAERQGLVMLDPVLAKEVSVALLEGRQVAFSSDVSVAGPLPRGLRSCEQDQTFELGVSISFDDQKRPFARTLRMVPRTVVVGIGCKRNTDSSTIARAVDDGLALAHLPREAVVTLASIDRKADEPGLLEFAKDRGLDLRFHAAAELAQVQGSFRASEFVMRTVGVDNVCERAACACGETLLAPKRVGYGVTVAFAARMPQIAFDETVGEGEPS